MSDITKTTITQEQASSVTADTVLTSTQDAESQTPISRVVVIAIDQSEHSQNAFDWAIKNFLRKDSDLVVLVNARPIPTVPGQYTLGASYMDFTEVIASLEEQHRVSSHNLLKDFAAKLKSHDFSCKAIAMRGDAREEIVRKVSELKASTLIVGSRGLGALKRMFLGSVSDYCSHQCDCTVIIVKTTDQESSV
ncbi:23986_t:CDS:2 [Dentiscutata erythropus]|uniref:23986_t:CDS:1 n=1 Tax=Dentiscutata erythropus TaxID=1348616 RepID=A0A9N9CW18_9GLOM|nr:23986_t:CDS:2 [Dentiscutata erythropus]